jgi:UDP-N-acetylglucosamine:LPS N-acetylglucosamine transferase
MPADASADGAAQLFLVCSAGGHLQQLLLLREAWHDRTHLWITDDAADTRSMLRDEPAVFGDPPSSRSLVGLFRNSLRAFHLVRRHRPAVIISTGAAIAVPFFWLGRLFGAETIYVESVTRIESASTTCRLVRPVADRVYVQWPELAERLPGALYEGTVFGAR